MFYAFNPNAEQQGKEGFGNAFKWDVDLLKGYEYEFVENVAKKPSSAYYSGCDTPKIGERIADYGATHVVTFGWYLKMHRQVLSYCKKNKIPIAVRGDSQLDPDLPFWKKAIKKMYYPYFLKRYDAFLSVGKRNRAYLKHYGVSDDKIIFSPHAIDQNFWKVEGRKEAGKTIFIWVAKFIPKKRPLDAIRAFKNLLEEEPALKEKLELRMIGSGELLLRAQREAENIDQIKFLGFKNQHELKGEYANADCLLLSSDYRETWGLVVNEAFAAGIPAIVSEGCGCSIDLIEENTGFTYPLADLKNLSDRMKQLYLKFLVPEKEDTIKNAIKRINKTYSMQRNLISFKQFLER